MKHRRALVSALYPIMQADKNQCSDERFLNLACNMMRAWLILEIEKIEKNEGSLLTVMARNGYDVSILRRLLDSSNE